MKLFIVSFSAWLASFIPTIETLQYAALLISIIAGLISAWKSLRRKG